MSRVCSSKLYLIFGRNTFDMDIARHSNAAAREQSFQDHWSGKFVGGVLDVARRCFWWPSFRNCGQQDGPQASSSSTLSTDHCELDYHHLYQISHVAVYRQVCIRSHNGRSMFRHSHLRSRDCGAIHQGASQRNHAGKGKDRTKNAWLLPFVHGESEVNVNILSAGSHKMLAFVATKAHLVPYTDWGKKNWRTNSPYSNSLFKSKFKMFVV